MTNQADPTLRVARVAVDMPLAHLDRLFDYRVPPALVEVAQPGVRVRVRFAGASVDGFIIEVVDDPEPGRELVALGTVVSPEPVLLPSQVWLCRAVADHWCGTFADVVRMAVPPRHALTEKATSSVWPVPSPRLPDDFRGALSPTPHAAGFLAAIAQGEAPRALWQVPPVFGVVGDWTTGIAEAIAACLASGRRAVVVVPDLRDLTQLDATLTGIFGAGTVARLHAQLGPSARYRQYLAISRGEAKIVIGTRSAAFAPIEDCGLVAIWDDGDDLHAEPRAPYYHARDVLALRAVHQKAAMLVASRSRSTEVQRWVENQWLVPLAVPRAELRREAPACRVAGDSDQALERDPRARSVRIPGLAFATIRAGLAQGPVLVQVPLSGYSLALACARCHDPARCRHCHGPLVGNASGGLACRWCGRVQGSFRCDTCGHDQLRSPVAGSQRTAEELGRAFPGTQVIDSSADHVVATVGPTPALVVATPGAEPLPDAGYSAAVLLDADQLVARADLRANEEALRRWLGVVGLVRPGFDGGTVVAVGNSQGRALQSLVRLDPATLAARELEDRREAHFPPSVRLFQLDSTEEGLSLISESARLLPAEGVLPGADLTEPIDGLEVLGPVPLDGSPDLHRLTLRVPLTAGELLTRRVKQGLGVGSARKFPPVRVRVDPATLG